MLCADADASLELVCLDAVVSVAVKCGAVKSFEHEMSINYFRNVNNLSLSLPKIFSVITLAYWTVFPTDQVAMLWWPH